MANFIPTISNFGAQAVSRVEEACSYIQYGAMNTVKNADKMFTAYPLANIVAKGANYISQHTNLNFIPCDASKMAILLHAVRYFVHGMGNYAMEGRGANNYKNRNWVEWSTTIAATLALTCKGGVNSDKLKSLGLALTVYAILNKGKDKGVEFVNWVTSKKAPKDVHAKGAESASAPKSV